MKPIPLTDPEGLIYAYACGACHHVPTIPEAMNAFTSPEEVVFTAETYRESAEACCTCRHCKEPLYIGLGLLECEPCGARAKAEQEERIAKAKAAQKTFDAKAKVALARARNVRAAQRLQGALSEISEEYYCASWLCGLEFTLWGMLEGAPRSFGLGEVTETEIATLRGLHAKCKGWWVWKESEDRLASGAVFVTDEEWRAIVAAHPEHFR